MKQIENNTVFRRKHAKFSSVFHYKICELNLQDLYRVDKMSESAKDNFVMTKPFDIIRSHLSYLFFLPILYEPQSEVRLFGLTN